MSGRADGGGGLPRLAEAALAGAALLAAGPVLAVAACLVRATSPGPAFFRQQRMGRGGRPFTLYKLRSMRTDGGGPGVTAGGDARVTPIGRVLRKTKIDELPELWNVVRGDMALVGPRPEVLRYVDVSDPLWAEVLQVRPGLTDPVTVRLRNEESLLAQVDGDREEFYVRSLLPYKLRGNLAYLRARSWRSDVGVLLRTAMAIVSPASAAPPSIDEIREGRP